jgi:hypothetical protein
MSRRSVKNPFFVRTTCWKKPNNIKDKNPKIFILISQCMGNTFPAFGGRKLMLKVVGNEKV